MPSRHRSLSGSGRRALAALALVVLAFAPARTARAVPSPANSFVPVRLVLCPAGDSVMVIVARDLANSPIQGDEVWLDVCDCPGLRLTHVPPACLFPDTSACRVAMITDSRGTAEIPVGAGGTCPGGSLRVFDYGVLLRVLPEPASLDQNGDLRVDSTDVAIVRGKLGTSDPSADFDGDGVVTMADVAILERHLGHAAADATPARPGPTPVWRRAPGLAPITSPR